MAPAELEAVLLTHPAVGDVAVIGLEDSLAGELPKAFVVLKPNVKCTAEDIQAFMAGENGTLKLNTGKIISLKWGQFI